MYGDTDQLRRRVDQLREQGADVRTLADQLVARTEDLGWTGRAAESMRLRIRERAAHLRGAAADHETAADSLDKHLADVAGLKDAISQRERTAAALVADELVPAGFIPPPPGHRDWLSVELPGL